MRKKLRLPKTRKPKRLRNDLKVRALRWLLDLGKSALRNPDGTVCRGNKKLETLRKEYSKI